MRSVDVYYNDIFVETLSEIPGGRYRFRYDEAYFSNESMPEISVTLPKRQQEYISENIFPFFTNMLPEGDNQRVVCRRRKIDEINRGHARRRLEEGIVNKFL